MTVATQSNIQTSQVRQPAHGTPKEVLDFLYESSDVPQSLIDECERLSLENNEIYFIFDNSISNLIKSRYASNKEEKREMVLDNIIGTEDKFHIGTELYFREMPSRFSYYDTETKELGKYKRYKLITDFLGIVGFQPAREFNFGQEFDQSYTLTINEEEKKTFIIRIKPNLFLSIQSGFTDNGHPNKIFDGFFSKSKILNSLKKENPNFTSVIRDIKLDIIL